MPAAAIRVGVREAQVHRVRRHACPGLLGGLDPAVVALIGTVGADARWLAAGTRSPPDTRSPRAPFATLAVCDSSRSDEPDRLGRRFSRTPQCRRGRAHRARASGCPRPDAGPEGRFARRRIHRQEASWPGCLLRRPFSSNSPPGVDYVLKAASEPGQNGRIQDEAEVLQKLRHQHIVEFCELIQIGEHAAFLDATSPRRQDRESG